MPAAYSMTFTPASMARISRLIGAAPIFAEQHARAMASSVNLVKAEAIHRAPVGTRPYTGGAPGLLGGGHGALMRGINGYVRSPWLGEVGVISAVPYGHRRELGFSGMTDRLWRYYPNDPGAFYLQNGLRASEPAIAAAFNNAGRMAFRAIAI